MPTKNQQGALYERAAQFAADLETGQTAAVDQLLAAWTQGYWQVRQDMDSLLAKVAEAKAAGTPMSPAWAYQQQRLKATLATVKTQMAAYAEHASQATTAAQASAMSAALKHAEVLAKTAVAESLDPSLAASFTRVNPAVLQAQVGFLTNGSPLRDLLVNTLPGEAALNVENALVKGLTMGWGQDKMVREATKALGLTHARAVTILRTESLRSYRHATRSTYMANQDVLEGWVWNAHLDARTCVACAVMDGTVHPIDATLDGHPRCRCAMVPRTKDWAALGQPGLPDTRPPIRSGKAWLEAQPPHVQRAMMGPRKFAAWTEGAISLDDMVGRTYHPAWGTTRSERSLKAILEDRNANWVDEAAPPPPVPPVGPPAPQKAAVAELVEDNRLRDLEKWAADPGDTGPQALANLHAAIAYLKNKDAPEQGPWLPRADQAKVDAMVAKMNAAVESKGYPSKGYSQVKAIYKAQANGTPGTQVGVIKSLTWEQKIAAQAALERHDDALPGLVRAHEKAKAVDAAHAEALALNQAYDAAKVKAIQDAADEAAEAQSKATQNHLYGLAVQVGTGKHAKAQAWLSDQVSNAQLLLKHTHGDDALNQAKGEAVLKAALVEQEKYQDAWASMKAHADTHWEASNGATGYVDQDGWFAISANGLDIGVPPPGAIGMVTNSNPGATATWTQVFKPNPSEVQKWLGVFKDNGLVVPKTYEASKAYLSNPNMTLTPQQVADLQEALSVAWATEKWTPEPDYVAKIVTLLDNGDTTPDMLRQTVLEAADAKPLSKANAAEAIAQWQAQQAAKAAPLPKPVIDPAKVKWDAASDAQVGKLLGKVQSGALTLDDLYASFHKSKNSGPKANYAKAILTLEGKADLIPGTLSDEAQELADLWTADLQAGLYGPEALEDVLNAAWSTANDKAAAAHVLAKVKPQAVTPPPAAVVPPVKAAAPTWNTTPPFQSGDLKFTGKTLGTHGAQVWEDLDGTRWLFKPPKDPKDGFLATLDEAASRLQALAGQKAPDTYVVTLGGKRGSIQRMFPATDGFPGGFKPSALSEADLDVVQREHVLDWLLSNHDGHRDQFLRLQDGTMVAIDKGQAFRWFGQDRLAWDFHPNAHYGAPEPIYNTLWREFAQGGSTEIDLPRLQAAIADVQAITDADLRALLRPYAEQAAARGLLAKHQPSFPGVVKPSIPANDVDAFLDAVVARKHNLEKDFQDLYDRAAKARAANVSGWKPATWAKATQAAATGKAGKWLGKPAPTKPDAPEPPATQVAHLFDTWVKDAKDRYAAFSGGKSLENSNNWARFRRVIDDLDENAVQELQDRHYLDDVEAKRARDLIAKAKAEKATLEAAHKTAMADYDKVVKRWKADLQDWRDANGITDLTRGMDEDVLRHTTNHAGEKWAQSKFTEAKYAPGERTTLRSYTGNAFTRWNDHARDSRGKPTQYADAYKKIDSAMAKQPIPEDVILHRGTDLVTFDDGKAFSGSSDLTQLIGNTLTDHGYMSSSVGAEAAFNGKSIQMKIRAPAGTQGSYVQMFSSFGSERELILARGTRVYVHNAYKVGYQWVVECEVVDDTFDPLQATPKPSATPWKPQA